MKKLVSILLLSFAIYANAQNKSSQKQNIDNFDVKVTSVSYLVDSSKELESIDWKEIKNVFELNKQSEKIELTFGLNYKESKNKIKSSITVSGESKNIDSLIVKAKKGIKTIIKISNKFKN